MLVGDITSPRVNTIDNLTKKIDTDYLSTKILNWELKRHPLNGVASVEEYPVISPKDDNWYYKHLTYNI